MNFIINILNGGTTMTNKRKLYLIGASAAFLILVTLPAAWPIIFMMLFCAALVGGM